MAEGFSIEIPHDEIEQFCQRWKIIEFALFGSVLREDFRADSDIDVLVAFVPKARWSLFDMVHMEKELEEILGRRVDLVERKAIEESENYIRRKHVLSSLKIIYTV